MARVDKGPGESPPPDMEVMARRGSNLSKRTADL